MSNVKNISYRSAPLFYREEGKGLPVVLIHGFAEDSTVWENQIEALKNSYRLLIPDLPGSGRSPSPPPTTIDSLAEAIKAILDAEDIRQAVLIGHSMGGYITLAFAEKYPDRLKAWGLFHSTAYADSDEKKAGRKKSIEFIRKNGTAAYIRQSIPNLFAENTRHTQPELISSLIHRYIGFNPDALATYQEAMIERPDRTQVLQQSPHPVLFIIGRHDPILPLDASLRQVHMPKLSHVHLLENSGHMGMLEDSARSHRILDDFLRPLSIQ